MSLSFQELYTRVTNILSDSSAATLALAKDMINDAYAQAIDATGIYDHGESTIITAENQYIYNLPASLRKISSAKIIMTDYSNVCTGTVAGKISDIHGSFTPSMVDETVINVTDNTSTRITQYVAATTVFVEDDIFESGDPYQVGNGNHYPMKEIASENEWNILQSSNVNVTTDYASHYFIRNRKIEVYPIPSTSNNILRLTYTKDFKDLSQDDYTTGTVTVTNGSTTITGSGTTFTSAMVGRYFKASGIWYRIKTFTSTTVIGLESPYEGVTTAGVSYTIGELPLIHSMFHPVLTYFALSFLYNRREQLDLGNRYYSLWRDGLERMNKFGADDSNNMTFMLNTGKRRIIDSSKDKLITT